MSEKFNAKDFIKYPIQPFNGYPKVCDADGNLILDVRGRGRLQYEIIDGKKVYNEQRGCLIQDEITKFIIEALNEKLKPNEWTQRRQEILIDAIITRLDGSDKGSQIRTTLDMAKELKELIKL